MIINGLTFEERVHKKALQRHATFLKGLAKQKDKETDTTVHIGEVIPGVVAELIAINARAQEKKAGVAV